MSRVLALVMLLVVPAPAVAKPARLYKLTLKGSASLQADSTSSFESQGCEYTNDRRSEVNAAFKGSARKLRLAKRTAIPGLRMQLSALSATTRTTTSSSCGPPVDVAPTSCAPAADSVAFAVGSLSPGELLAFRNADAADVFESCQAEDDVGGVLKTIVTTKLPQQRIARLKRGHTASDKGTFTSTGGAKVSVQAPYEITVKRTR